MLALAILWASLSADAQQAGQRPRIGYLSNTSPAVAAPFLEAFRHGLREHGWLESQNLVMEYRWAEGHLQRLPELAAELVRLPVDVLVTGVDAAAQAAKDTTTTIPIVMFSGAPVETGLVASLARPGGNVTGLSLQAPETGGKRLELLKDAVPQAARVAVLWHAAYPGKALEWQATQAAARTMGVALHSVEVRGPDDFDGAFAAIAREPPDALIVFVDPLTLAHRRRIVDFATQQRLPMIAEVKPFAEAGGLMTYGMDLLALYRRAAYYVDSILKGRKPADLPVEQPREFAFVINLKAAQSLGLTLPHPS
jgi:putative ABC transport system substrate-binding protein